MIAQSTLISYHTEAFVKTEVACTVKNAAGLNILGKNSLIFGTFLPVMILSIYFTGVRKAFRSASPRKWRFPQELNRVTTPKPQALYLVF